MVDEILDIENNFHVYNLQVNSELIWPILREHYISQLSGFSRESFFFSPSFIINKIKSVLYGWQNWFKKYDVICISSAGGGYRRIIDEKYKNRFIDPIIETIGEDNVLLIEYPTTTHFSKHLTYTKHITSGWFLNLFITLISFLILNIRIKGIKVLDNIQREYNINVNDVSIIKIYLSEKYVYKLIFKLYKPKAVFLTCYYGREAEIRAAKELKIPVIEIQHGIIGPKHHAYNQKILTRDYYPDYLLTFGNYKATNPSESFIFDKTQVYPIGNYYIEYINNLGNVNILKKLTNKYNYTVAVTLQSTIEKELVNFIIEAATLDPCILYLLIPRQKIDAISSLPNNVKIINSLNFYEIMACVDFHSTVYSTCAIEAPSLGIQNILINIKGFAKDYYGDLLSDEKITRYVETPEELVNTINTMKKMDKKTIMDSNNHLFVPNYHENLHIFLQKIKLI